MRQSSSFSRNSDWMSSKISPSNLALSRNYLASLSFFSIFSLSGKSLRR